MVVEKGVAGGRGGGSGGGHPAYLGKLLALEAAFDGEVSRVAFGGGGPAGQHIAALGGSGEAQ